MPRDLQYVYMAPGGDHKIVKDLLTPPHEQARQFKEMLCVTKLLPAGEMPKLSKKLVLQWYDMTYHRADCTEYLKSKKKLAAETIESLTNYFWALFSQKKLMARLNVPRSIDCAIAQKNNSRATSATNARRAGRDTHTASSGSADDATTIGCIVNATTAMIATIAIMATVAHEAPMIAITDA